MDSLKEPIFDDMVIGNSNRTACQLCHKAVYEEMPLYNPIFIYGESGTGKTHLLKSLEAEILDGILNKKCLYVTADDLVVKVISAVRNNQFDSLINELNNYDVILIDDIQGLSGKEVTQEAFFKILDYYISNRKIIVVTSNCPLRDISKLMHRLYSRLASGIEIEIKPMDYEMRFDLLNKWLSLYELNVDVSMLSELARKPVNAFELAGMIKSLAFEQEMPNEDYNMQENIRNNWKFILKRIKEEYRVSDLSFDLWIEHLEIENISNGVLRLSFDGERVMCLFIKDKFGPMISAVVSELIGRDIRVEVCNKA